MPERASYASRICQALRARGMTREQLCSRAEISKGTMDEYCTNEGRIPRFYQLHAMAQVFGCSELWLAGYSWPASSDQLSQTWPSYKVVRDVILDANDSESDLAFEIRAQFGSISAFCTEANIPYADMCALLETGSIRKLPSSVAERIVDVLSLDAHMFACGFVVRDDVPLFSEENDENA